MSLDEANQRLLQALLSNGIPPPSEIGLPRYRALLYDAQAKRPRGPDVASVTDVVADQDGCAVPLRIYVPEGNPIAVMLYMHGGGWTTGSIAGWDPVMRRLANATQCIVLSVEYRLAPEHPFPAAVDDVLAALGWVAANRACLPGAALPLVIAGDSAGGNLAAAVAILARDAAGPEIALQLLVYPSVSGDIDLPSLTDLTPPRLTRDDIGWYYDSYLPDRGARRDPRFSPLDADDLSSLPPALILTAENDVLRGQAEAYGMRLIEAGVPVAMRRHLGTMHGFLNAGEAIPQSGTAMRDIAEFIAGHLQPGAAA